MKIAVVLLALAFQLVAARRAADHRHGHHRHHGHHGHHESRSKFFIPVSATDDAGCTEEAVNAEVLTGYPGKNNTVLDNLNIGDTLVICLQRKHWGCEEEETGVEERGIGARVRGMIKRMIGNQEDCNKWKLETGTIKKSWKPDWMEKEYEEVDGEEVDDEEVDGEVETGVVDPAVETGAVDPEIDTERLAASSR
ncbi:uncharacterized protein LOC111701637 isoform X2 [Eurytemora carolleeae]|nr:uncharacterized protein LOC111701637 isoform X2 [Eurytemora carolleeae]|eukprot:XP_023328782.1 uncharacterized protein LOC111701637 isoform X2 [Eurytemora affinis]